MATTSAVIHPVTRPVKFALVVDNFAVQFVGKQHADHLLQILHKNYKAVCEDWEAKLFCGITFDWDYAERRTCTLSMPGYIKATLLKYTHPTPSQPQHAPHRYNPPTFGTKQQKPEPLDTTAIATPQERKRIQRIVGTLLFYCRAVDPTLAVTLSDLASEQSRATELTLKDVHQLLDYCATHPDAKLRYHASNMQLGIHSDASYLNAPKGRSRVGGYFYLGDPSNGAILTPTGILKLVVSSAAESEIGGLFANLKEGVIIRQTLTDMGHPQNQTPVQTDNSTASGFADDSIKQQKTRAIDMRFHWVRDRQKQRQFKVFWDKAARNRADYFTKHHPTSHHQAVRPTYHPSPSS